jgi:hypothetical protein
MNIGDKKIDAGVVKFALQYRKDIMSDQGVCIQVLSDVDGKEEEILRFDCFDHDPHYHYGPAKKNERLHLDKTTAGNSIGWTLKQLRARLPDMVRRAGYDDIADQLNNYQQATSVASKLNTVESTAREMASSQRRTVTHNRGDEVIEAGNVRFGLEFRELGSDRGLAIHVLSDVAGQEVELLAFDCFENEPHYHYGPRNKDIRLYWDTTTVPDTLRWTLDQFKDGNLPNMIERAGYPGVVAELDRQLVISTLENQVEPKALATRKANSK